MIPFEKFVSLLSLSIAKDLPTDFATASQLRSAQEQTSTKTEIPWRGKQQSVLRGGSAPWFNPLPLYTPLFTFVYLPLKNSTHLTCLLIRTGMNRENKKTFFRGTFKII